MGGTIAAVGQRLIDGTAKMMIKRFFDKLAAEAAIHRSQRDVAVLLARHGVDLGFEHAQARITRGPGFVRLDHVVDKAVLGGDERIGEAFAELVDFLARAGLRVIGRRPVRGGTRCSPRPRRP